VAVFIEISLFWNMLVTASSQHTTRRYISEDRTLICTKFGLKLTVVIWTGFLVFMVA
jgi:hypothetical protein